MKPMSSLANWGVKAKGPSKPFSGVAEASREELQAEVVRLRSFCMDDEAPMVETVTDLWPCANWFEREAFDHLILCSSRITPGTKICIRVL